MTRWRIVPEELSEQMFQQISDWVGTMGDVCAPQDVWNMALSAAPAPTLSEEDVEAVARAMCAAECDETTSGASCEGCGLWPAFRIQARAAASALLKRMGGHG